MSENLNCGADGQAEQYHFLRCKRQNHRQHQARIGGDEFAARGPAGTHLLHSRDAGRPSESVGGHGGDVFGQRHDKAASDREGALHLFYRRQPRRRQRDLPPRFHRRRHVRGFACPGCQKASLSQLCLADGGCKRAPLRAEHHHPRQGAGRIFLLPSDRICRQR